MPTKDQKGVLMRVVRSAASAIALTTFAMLGALAQEQGWYVGIGGALRARLRMGIPSKQRS